MKAFKIKGLIFTNPITLKYNGKTQTIKQWGLELGISKKLIYQRIMKYEWSVERALSTPLIKKYENRIK